MSGPIRPSIQLWLTASKRREREILRGLKAATDAAVTVESGRFRRGESLMRPMPQIHLRAIRQRNAPQPEVQPAPQKKPADRSQRRFFP